MILNKEKIVKIIIVTLCIILLIGLIIWKNIARNNEQNISDNNIKIVTSFYPMYIISANITKGANNVELTNMADMNVGCLHDYTLTTEDMKKIENADIFIENGLGMENFITKILETNNSLKIVDSSTGIENLISEGNETNAHIWTSIENYILQVKNISEGLKSFDAKNADTYEKNEKQYVEKLENLKNSLDSELKKLNEKKAVCLNEAFEYMGQEIGLDMLSVQTSHEENTMSAEELKEIIDTMNNEDIDIIIIDKDDNKSNAETIASETGAIICELNSGLTGSLNEDAYIDLMQDNINKLKIFI